ncbi:MAG TPA: hypothetical protein PK536_12490, partial [Ignavibacteria bacterium]|nr:hypothetical protein [Ignavibacteria bacterium]
ILLSEEFGYENYIKFRAGSNRLKYVFSYAKKKGIKSGYLKKIINMDNVSLSDSKKEFEITVKYFDNSRIFINGKELKDSIWMRPRSKSIFLYFVYRSKNNQAITKDTLIDDLLYSSKKVNYEAIADVEINNVRKSLQNFFASEFPEVSGKEFIVLKSKIYNLSSGNIDLRFNFDTDEFMRISSGNISSDSIKIIDIYKNDFASGVYNNWAEDIRDNFKFIYFKTIHKIIAFTEKNCNQNKLKKILEKLCESGNSDEEILTKLLLIYRNEKNDKRFIQVYDSFIKRLVKDLNFKPSEVLKKHYHEIKK